MFQFSQEELLEISAGAYQSRLDGFLGCLELLRDLSYGPMFEIFEFEQCAFLDGEAVHTVLEQNPPVRFAVVRAGSGVFDETVLRETLQEGEVTAALAALVGSRTARKHGEPAPESSLVGEHPDVSDDPVERFLERVTRGVFVAGSNDQEVARQSVKVGILENTVGGLVASSQPSGQYRDIKRVPRNAGVQGSAILRELWMDMQPLESVCHGSQTVPISFLAHPAWAKLAASAHLAP
jgi:hypothetical protein